MTDPDPIVWTGILVTPPSHPENAALFKRPGEGRVPFIASTLRVRIANRRRDGLPTTEEEEALASLEAYPHSA